MHLAVRQNAWWGFWWAAAAGMGTLLYAKNIMGFKSIFLCIVFNGRQKVLDRLRSRPRNSIQFYNMAMGQKFWFSERSRLYTFIVVSILHHYFNLHVCMSLSLRPCMHQPSVTLKHFFIFVISGASSDHCSTTVKMFWGSRNS